MRLELYQTNMKYTKGEVYYTGERIMWKPSHLCKL
jgi:hypothetical protein